MSVLFCQQLIFMWYKIRIGTTDWKFCNGQFGDWISQGLLGVPFINGTAKLKIYLERADHLRHLGSGRRAASSGPSMRARLFRGRHIRRMLRARARPVAVCACVRGAALVRARPRSRAAALAAILFIFAWQREIRERRSRRTGSARAYSFVLFEQRPAPRAGKREG